MAKYNYLHFMLIILMACAIVNQADPSSEAQNLRKLAKANNYLAVKVHKKLSAGSSENVFFSPFSLSCAFGMLYYGTSGETANELRNTLGYERADLADDEVHQSFHKYLTDYLDSDTYILDVANAILVSKRLQLIDSYRTNVENLYQSVVQDVDFSTNSRRIVNKVNIWVKAKTHDKIDRLLDDISPLTAVLLLNAVYFKGAWKTPFSEEGTFKETFYNRGLKWEAKEVPMMHIESRFPYASVEGIKALELPYEGNNISMLILLPKERNGLGAMELDINRRRINRIRSQLQNTTVFVKFPKFKVEYSKELSRVFETLGANKIFSAGSDFTRMTASSNVFVSEVLHKAVVEVNEQGSEAAAVTAIMTTRTVAVGFERIVFEVDHPFVFAIIDKRNGMILFMGRINNL